MGGILIAFIVILVWLGTGAGAWIMACAIYRTIRRKNAPHEFHSYRMVSHERDGDYITFNYECCSEGDQYQTTQYLGTTGPSEGVPSG